MFATFNELVDAIHDAENYQWDCLAHKREVYVEN